MEKERKEKILIVYLFDGSSTSGGGGGNSSNSGGGGGGGDVTHNFLLQTASKLSLSCCEEPFHEQNRLITQPARHTHTHI